MKIKNKVLSALHEVWMSGALVKVKRERFDTFHKGFVIDISEGWLLLHILEAEYLQFDGYEAVRLQDISEVEKDTSWIAQACVVRGLEPILQPDVLLVDLPGLLSSVDAHFPVLGIEPEKIDADILYIGRITKLKKKTVLLRKIDRLAKWSEEDTPFRLKDITKVSFGTSYMKLLLEFARAQEAEAANGPDNL
ncbi:MAG: hypothetical protein V4671_29990 [Armatimonadota bacterium]